MRRLIACLTLAAAVCSGASALADEADAHEAADVPEVPAEEQPETLATSDDSEGSPRALRLFGEATAWFAQPVGADYVYAVEIDPDSPLNSRTIGQEIGTGDRLRWRAGALVKGDIGSFVFTYWSASVVVPDTLLVPGRFVVGESMTYPLFAGLNNDGLSDGVTATSRTLTRDIRIDFLRDAFRSGRMSAKWLAGLRFVDHSRSLSAVYYALVPNLPPLINSEGALDERLIPKADRAERVSQFSGRGIEAGFEATYEVVPGLRLDGSFIYALLRGKARAGYASTTYLYMAERPGGDPVIVAPSAYECVFSNPSGARCDIYEPLAGDDPNDPNYVDYGGYGELSQQSFVVGLRDLGSSNSASILEANLGFRWRAWRTLEVLGGIRQTRHQDVVLQLRPRDPTLSPDGSLNYRVFEKEYRSVAYEGYYLGLAYTF